MSLIADITAPPRPEAVTRSPEVGIGATVVTSHVQRAATVVNIERGGKTVWIQYDTAERVDGNGISNTQEYVFSANPNGRIAIYTLRTNGEYILRGENYRNGARLVLGVRREFWDMSV